LTVEKLYSKEEAAKILSISPITLGDWLRKGKIRGVKLGRVWRIPESALEELARDGTRKE
jgi:excisionase family DNA binding protein